MGKNLEARSNPICVKGEEYDSPFCTGFGSSLDLAYDKRTGFRKDQVIFSIWTVGLACVRMMLVLCKSSHGHPWKMKCSPANYSHVMKCA